MPQRRFASIHVVGSNGKSSTVRFTAGDPARARAARRRLHVAAPALVRRADRGRRRAGAGRRLRRRGRARRAGRGAGQPHAADDDDQVTQFEALTAAAYYELARRGVEVAVDRGGPGRALRRDQRDPVGRAGADQRRPRAHALARARPSRDIAEEKLAVVRDHATLVVAPDLHPDAMEVAERVARRAPRPAGPRAAPPREEPLRARGAFQRRNFARGPHGRRRVPGRAPRRRTPSQRAAATVEVPGRMQVVDRGSADDLRRRPQRRGRRRAGRGAARGGRRPPARRRASRSSTTRTRTACCAALLPLCDARRLHARVEPALAAGRHARVAGGAARRPAAPRPSPTRARAVARARELAGPDGAVVATGSIYLIADLVREPGAARASTL